MAFVSYPRIGTISLANFKAMIESDTVFNSLSTAQKNAIINTATQRIASLRNGLSKSDYNFDSVGNPDILIELAEYSQYIRYVFINAGITYDGTLYSVDTVLVEQGPTGFVAALDTTWESDEVTIRSEGEFTLGILYDSHNATVIVTKPDENTFVVDMTNATEIVTFEIYRL